MHLLFSIVIDTVIFPPSGRYIVLYQFITLVTKVLCQIKANFAFVYHLQGSWKIGYMPDCLNSSTLQSLFQFENHSSHYLFL